MIALACALTALAAVKTSAQDPTAAANRTGRAGGGAAVPQTPGAPDGPQGPARGAGFGRGRTFDTAAIERAKPLFSSQCAFCHGDDARGRAAGPDLARSLVVLGDTNGKDLIPFLRTGRPPAMPAFASLTDAQIADIAEFLHMTLEAAKSRRPTDTLASLVGDSKAGEVYFNGAGKCSACHSVTGDLAHLAAKYNDPATLQDRMINPRPGGGRGGQPIAASSRSQRTATVTLANGQTVSGTLEYLSEFAVTVVDKSGARKTFTRDGETPKVSVQDPLQAHFDMLRTFRDKDMQDLTAYLWTLK
jgi:mono/diheme cytochrome c family protein